MKKTQIFSLFILILSIGNLISQNLSKCTTLNAFATQTNMPLPTNCDNFLNEFLPTSTSPILTVNINFVVFVPTATNIPGEWSQPSNPTTYTSAVACCNSINYYLSHLDPPNLQKTGIPFIYTDSRIRVAPGTFTIIQNDNAYFNVENPVYTNPYLDPTAITIFMGAAEYYPCTLTLTAANNTTYTAPGMCPDEHIFAPFTPGPFPHNYIIFHTQNVQTVGYSNISNYGNTAAHEFGHVLGLNHTTYSGGSYDVSSISTGLNCCGTITASDYEFDDGGLHGCSWTNTVNNQTYAGSNNLMSQNTGCGNRYLSSQQIAIMRYNLTTILNGFLTTQSYSDATGSDNTLIAAPNQTWTLDKYIKGNVTIPTGTTLKIKCGVAMTKNAYIEVEPGAQLIIDGGHITNISGRVWQGIKLRGYNNQDQSYSNSSSCQGCLNYQGVVKIINNGMISHAFTAIDVANSNSTGATGGGLVDCQDAIFSDNYRDVNFSKYAFQRNYSRFIRTKFLENGVIGDNFWPDKHVMIYKNNGITFFGCLFQNTVSINTNINRGTGIYSTDANFTISKYMQTISSFSGLDKGIFVNNINPISGPSIYNCYFYNNYGYGAYFMNTNYLAFNTNTVQTPGCCYVWSGVYLNNCKYFKIMNNTIFEEPIVGYFFKNSDGLSIYKSTFGYHQVYRNSFGNLYLGINSLGDNSGLNNLNDGLKINCNDFNLPFNVGSSSQGGTPTYTNYPNLYDVALDLGLNNAPPSVMKKQGEINLPLQNRFNLVRNLYGANCNGTQQNKWYIHSASTKTVDHGVNTQAVTNPSACSNNLVNVASSTISLNYSSDCEVNPASVGGSASSSPVKVDNLNNYITALRPVANDGDNKNEIQASVSAKLNLFITDSLVQCGDSVVAIFENNQGSMLDADVQTVFAHLAKGDFAEATSKINSLASTKPDWANLLNKLVAIEQESEGIYSLNTNATNRNFFINHANTEGIDGQSVAQAILKAACDINYIEPHNRPEQENTGARSNGQINSTNNSIQENSELPTTFKIFPNPVNSNLTLEFYSNSIRSADIEIKDVLGRLLLKIPIEVNTSQNLLTEHYKNGLYFITISENQKIIATYKLIKQD